MAIIQLFLALLPAVIILTLVIRRDSENPEPRKWIVASVVLGIVSALIAILVGFISYEFDASDLDGAFLKAFLNAAVPEELAKFFVLWAMVRNNRYFDEWFDGIVYAVCIGMGFAGFENILYICGSPDWLSTGITRALLSVPAHFMFAVVMGYYFSLGWFEPARRRYYFTLAIAAPIVIHGLYDTVCFSAGLNEGIAVLILVVFLISFRKLMKYTKSLMLHHLERDRASFPSTPDSFNN